VSSESTPHAKTANDGRGAELRSAFWLGTIQVSRIVAGLVVGIIVVRYLGADDYGALVLALSISSFFNAFATLGLPRVVLKELALSKEEGRSVLSAALLLQVAGSLVGVGGTWVVCILLNKPDEITAMAVVFSLALVFGGGIIVQQALLTAHRTHVSAWANMASIGTNLVYRVGLVVSQATVCAFAFANIIQNVFYFVLSLAYGRSVLSSLGGSFWPHRDVIVRLLTGAWPLFLASFINSIPVYSDRLIIGQELSLSDVGLYAVLLQLAAMIQMMISAFIAGASPRLVRLLNGNAEERQGVVGLLAEATALAVGGGVAFVLLGPFLIPLLYGPEFEVDFLLLMPLALGVVVMAPNAMRAEYLLIVNKQRTALYLAAIYAVLAVASQIAMISAFGLMGAAVSYFIQHLFFAAVLNHMFASLTAYRVIYWASLRRGITLAPLFKLAMTLKAGVQGKLNRPR